jgi:hypothetical protein
MRQTDIDPTSEPKLTIGVFDFVALRRSDKRELLPANEVEVPSEPRRSAPPSQAQDAGTFMGQESEGTYIRS